MLVWFVTGKPGWWRHQCQCQSDTSKYNLELRVSSASAGYIYNPIMPKNASITSLWPSLLNHEDFSSRISNTLTWAVFCLVPFPLLLLVLFTWPDYVLQSWQLQEGVWAPHKGVCSCPCCALCRKGRGNDLQGKLCQRQSVKNEHKQLLYDMLLRLEVMRKALPGSHAFHPHSLWVPPA